MRVPCGCARAGRERRPLCQSREAPAPVYARDDARLMYDLGAAARRGRPPASDRNRVNVPRASARRRAVDCAMDVRERITHAKTRSDFYPRSTEENSEVLGSTVLYCTLPTGSRSNAFGFFHALWLWKSETAVQSSESERTLLGRLQPAYSPRSTPAACSSIGSRLFSCSSCATPPPAPVSTSHFEQLAA